MGNDSNMSSVPRSAALARSTKETDIQLALTLDGSGAAQVNTGVPFFDHMLDAFARHSLFDLNVTAKGDLEVDAHHTVEDVGIVLGCAFARAVGEKRGIARFGSCALPMDEALIVAACDLSGRGQLHWSAEIPPSMLGIFDSSLAKEFFIAFASNAGLTLHIRQLAGENPHHIIEAIFKACARALSEAVRIDERLAGQLPSTKGAL